MVRIRKTATILASTMAMTPRATDSEFEKCESIDKKRQIGRGETRTARGGNENFSEHREQEYGLYHDHYANGTAQ